VEGEKNSVPSVSQKQSEAAEAWGAVRETTSIQMLETFAAHYADTFYAELAGTRIAELSNQLAAAARERGDTGKGWLGARLMSVPDDMAEQYGIARKAGALVASVDPDSAAANAGIQPGDIILKFDGKAISRMRDLPSLIRETPSGKYVELELMRDGGKLALRTALGRLNVDAEAFLWGRQTDASKSKPKEPNKAAAKAKGH
jgi:C-terminal processing protease CtpA/Prc